MAFSKARRLSDFIAADGTIPTGKFASGTITSDHIADTGITHADLHTNMDLTGKTVLVANASTGDSDTTAANTAFVQQEIAALVDSSPSALNTLNELAAALGDDANFSTTVTNSIATKLPLAGGTMTGDLLINANLQAGDGTNLSMDSTGNGQIKIAGNGYKGAIALDASAMRIYHNSSIRDLVLGTNEEARLTIKGNTGYHGIGTDSPSELLEVYSETASTAIEVSAGKASTTTGEAKIVLRSLHSASGTVYSRSEIGSIGVAGGDSDLVFRTTTDSNGPQERMRISDIGTTTIGAVITPTYNNSHGYPLHIQGSGGNQTYLSISVPGANSGDTGLVIGHDATGTRIINREDDPIIFSRASGESMRIGGSGNVGFGGQTNPGTPIHVGVSTSTGPRIQITHENSGGFGALDIDAYGSATFRLLSNWTGSAMNGLPVQSFGLLTPHAYDIHIGTAGASRLRVKADGKVAVGNVNPYAQFTVYRSGTDSYSPTSFLDQPTMELKGDNHSGGYIGTRITNTSGNYEWFYGVNQHGSNQADFVLQGYDRPSTVYQEMARMHDIGAWNVPQQPHWCGSITNTTGSGFANSAAAQHSRNTINYVSQSGYIRFVAPIAGIYLLTFTSISDNGTARTDSSIRINGTSVTNQLNNPTSSAGYRQRTAVITVNLAKDDQITVAHDDWYASTGTGFENWRTFSMAMIA